MEIRQLEGAIEAILFTMGEAVELCQIAKAIQQDKATTEKLIHNLMDKYQDEGRGIHIIELENSYQLCTKRDYYGCLIRIAMQPEAGTYRRYAGDFVHHCLQAAGDQGRDREDPRGKKRPRSEQAGGI